MQSMGITVRPVYAITGLSLANVAGRVGLGALSDFLYVVCAWAFECLKSHFVGVRSQHKLNRVWWVITPLFVQVIVLFVQAFSPGAIVGTATVVGFTFGGIMSCTLTVVGTWFGTPHQGTNNGVVRALSDPLRLCFVTSVVL